MRNNKPSQIRPKGWPYFQSLILFWCLVLPSHFSFAVHENFPSLLQFFNDLVFYCSFLESLKCKRFIDQDFFNWFHYFPQERRDDVWHFSFGHSALLLKVKDNGFGSSFLIQSTASCPRKENWRTWPQLAFCDRVHFSSIEDANSG